MTGSDRLGCGCWTFRACISGNSKTSPCTHRSYCVCACAHQLLCCTEHLDSLAVQHAAALAPVIASLQEEVAGLRRELDQQRLQAAVAQQELDGMANRLNEVCWGIVLYTSVQHAAECALSSTLGWCACYGLQLCQHDGSVGSVGSWRRRCVSSL